MASSDIANLGVLGRFYSARNVLGFYRTTSALAVISFSTQGLSEPDSWFKTRIHRALYKTVQAHPSLCYGILDETTDREAVFLRLPVIYRDDVAEFEGDDPSESGATDDDLAIRKLLEKSHARILLEGHRKPAWRVVVLKHGSQWDSGVMPKVQRVSIAFLANHAIADGLSHINFHRTLFQFFHDSESDDHVWPYHVPRDLRCPILLEEAVDLQSVDENDKHNINYGSSSVWSGANMFLPSVEDYASGLRFITIPQVETSRVVTFCRSQKITLTGMFHGFIVAFLARYVPAGHNFLAVTPYSMRHISKVDEDEICNHASGLVHEFAGPLISSLRSTREDSLEELDLMIKVAQVFGKDIAAELKRSPKNNAWAGMFGVKDWYSQSMSQLGKKRPLTYELSSFGRLKVVEGEDRSRVNPELADSSLVKESGEHGSEVNPRLSLEKMLVSQCGSVTGPVFCCNCISIADGPLTVTLTWQKGSMEEQMIEDMAEYLLRRFINGLNDVVSKS